MKYLLVTSILILGLQPVISQDYITGRIIDRETMENGYFESGILVRNILRQWFFGYGLGVFYRYGPYSFTKTIDNFAFKFTITFNI